MKKSLAAMAAMALTTGGPGVQVLDLKPVAQSQPADRAPVSPTKQKRTSIKETAYRRINRNYCGKRYAASVRQHQRHALKAKNRKRARARA